MKKYIKKIAIAIFILAAIWLLLTQFLFRIDFPRLASFKESYFDVSTPKPLYFKVDKDLYCAMDGKFTYNLKPIWKGDIEEAFIAPDGKHVVIYNKNKLLLIDNKGKPLFKIDDCTGRYAVAEERDNGRFIASSVQWSQNSDAFLVLQDRVWNGNFSKSNRSSVYKYVIADRVFKSLIDLDEEGSNDVALSKDGSKLYYEFATPKGALAFKKVDLKTRKILSEHFSDDSLRLKGITADSIFLNYKPDQFDQSSYDLKGVFTTAFIGNDSTGLYYWNKKRTICFLSGLNGYASFKGQSFDFFSGGYFLPGSRFFAAYIEAKNFTGQVIIDMQTLKIMKMKKPVVFYFNINTNDCPDFVFRGQIEPKVTYSSEAEAAIRHGK